MPKYLFEGTHDTGQIAPTSGNGVRETSHSVAEGRMVIDMADRIFVTDLKVSPFTTLLTSAGKTWDGKTLKGTSLRKRVVENPEFSWLEDNLSGNTVKVGGAGYAASGDITVTVTGAGATPAYLLTPQDVVLNVRTGERFRVATVPTSSTFTAVSADRAFGSTPAAAGLAGDELLILASVNEQFGTARNINNTRSVKASNYIQTHRTSIGATRHEMVSKLYGGPDLAHQRTKKSIEHQRFIENSMIHGEKKATTGAQGHTAYATGGLREHLETNGGYQQNQNGQPLTPADLDVFCRESFINGGANTKLFMCGARVLSALSEPSRGQLQTLNGATTYGVKINRWLNPHGDLDIVQNPLLTGDFSGYGFCLDMESYRYAVMPGGDTRLITEIQDNSADGRVDEITSDFGLERVMAGQNSFIKGVL